MSSAAGQSAAPSTGLARKISIRELVDSYNESVASMRHAVETIDEANARLNATWGMRCEIPNIRLEDAIESLTRASWHSLVARLELKRTMSHERWKALNRLIDESPWERKGKSYLHDKDTKFLPTITHENVEAFVAQYSVDRKTHFEEAVKEAFEWLRPDRNSKWGGSQFKTNQKNAMLEIGEVVHLTSMVSQKWSGRGFDVRDWVSQRLTVLENVFAVLDGAGASTHRGYRSDLENAIGTSPDGHAKTPYFEARCFKNGNMRLRFLRSDLLARFNQIAGGTRLKPTKEDAQKMRDEDAQKQTGVKSIYEAIDDIAQAPANDVDIEDAAFFPTNDDLADEAVRLLDLNDGARVLEPSAGKGSLANAVRRACPTAVVDCVELLPEHRAVLVADGFRVIAEDFLRLRAPDAGTYDAIVMNPPFGSRRELLHLMHALRFLRAGGRLAAILPKSVEYGHTNWHEEMREALEVHEVTFTDNAPDAFKEAGATVHTVTMVLTKAA